MNLRDRCIKLACELGLGTADKIKNVEPLTGGVASDIAIVELENRKLCMKFALPKLRVEADWHVPVHRNAAEYAWLEFCSKTCPDSSVQLLGRSTDRHGFAMEFIEGQDVYLWKSALLAEAPDRGEAMAVGDLLGRIHAASTDADFDPSSFRNQDDFYAIRTEPYIVHTRAKYPELRNRFDIVINDLKSNVQVLVHGDASPKNIMFRDRKPVILDAECATMGDPCFDPAFCLNHLLLKAVHLPDSTATYLRNARELWQAYKRFISWEDPAELEERLCRLLPLLFLARVDGKSPVEYLGIEAQEKVRGIALDLLRVEPVTLDKLLAHVRAQLEKTSS